LSGYGAKGRSVSAVARVEQARNARRERHADEAAEAQLAYEQELLTGEAADVLAALVDSAGITQRELADRLGVTEARVSQLLSGKNINLHSLAHAGWALGVRFILLPVSMEDERAATPAADDPEPGWLPRLQRVLLRRSHSTTPFKHSRRRSRPRS
jgi:transcriptional regulator with XRE-family HTH domain